MGSTNRDFNPMQLFFLVLGTACLGLAFWTAFGGHRMSNDWTLLVEVETRETVLIFTGGMSALFFVLATVIHVRG